MGEFHYETKEEDGIIKYQCPNCEQWYKPTFKTKEDAPQGSIGHEQHQTGICSDKCWDEYLGFDCFLEKDPLEKLLGEMFETNFPIEEEE